MEYAAGLYIKKKKKLSSVLNIIFPQTLLGAKQLQM